MGRHVADGTIMSPAEEQWMHEFEREHFGRVLERDVNGDPIGHVTYRKCGPGDEEGSGFVGAVAGAIARGLVDVTVNVISHLRMKSK